MLNVIRSRKFSGLAALLLAYLVSGNAFLSEAASNGSSAEPAPIGRVEGFSDWVTSLAFTPDGTTLAAGGYETIQLASAADAKVRARLETKPGYVKALAFSPDGKLLAAGHYQAVTLWNPGEQKPVKQLKGHRAYVTGVAFSPDGRRLATSSEDETARIWDVAKGTTIATLKGHSYPVNAIAFSPDGKLLATAAGDETRVTKPGEVKLWDAETGEEIRTFPEHAKAATGVAFSPDGKRLVSTSFDEKVNVYEVATGKALGFFGGHSRPTNAAVFAPNGELVISASGGRAVGKNEVMVWNVATGETVAAIEGHTAKVSAIALAPSGRTLATGSYDQTAALWNVAGLLGVAEETPAEQTVALVSNQTEGEAAAQENNAGKTLRVGIIGLDTSHAIAFTKILNDPKVQADVAGCRVVAAYPKGSPDIESSVSRVPGYTKQVQEMGVEIVDSIDALLEKVDCVLLETNDGRPHLEQVIPVLKAGKPVFIDKPIAGSLTDAVAIFELGRHYQVPLFSSSSLRYSPGAQALRNGKIGDILGCDAYSPCSLEKTHPDLFWYGIHGVETLFTVMGTGCERVSRASTDDFDVVVGVWDGGRIGTFRGIRRGKTGYGGTAFGMKAIEQIGPYGGYRPLLVEIVKFFKTGEVPVAEKETLEIYAFMEAADESKRQGGAPVSIESVLEKARKAAKPIVAKHTGQ